MRKVVLSTRDGRLYHKNTPKFIRTFPACFSRLRVRESAGVSKLSRRVPGSDGMQNRANKLSQVYCHLSIVTLAFPLARHALTWTPLLTLRKYLHRHHEDYRYGWVKRLFLLTT